MGIFFTRIKHHVVGNHVKRIHVKRGTAVVEDACNSLMRFPIDFRWLQLTLLKAHESMK